MSITLNSKVYNAIGWNQNQQFVYNETSAGVPSGFSYLTTKVGLGTGKTNTMVKWNLTMPIVALEASECACPGDPLRSYFGKFELTIPAGSTLAERTDYYDRIVALVATTEFANSVKGLVQPNS